MTNKLDIIAKKFKDEAIVPFWMWNDKLDRMELLRQLREIKSKGINQYIIHPRFGLETEYLSEAWFEYIKIVLDESKKLHMGVWIYDEINWPSGYAGGKVLSKNPEFRAKHMTKRISDYHVKSGTWHPAYSKEHYIDVLNPKAVKSFIANVYDEYWKRFNKYFGDTILGFFTDEPGIYNNFAGVDLKSIPWSDSLPDFYLKEQGANILKDLDNIWSGSTAIDVERRISFWKTISLLYQKSYFQQIQSWCHKKGVLFIGHVLAEESMVDTAKTQGSFFTAMKHLDFAGYDLLSRLEQRAVIPARLAHSAAKHLNLYGVTAETFGIFGWDLTNKDMRDISEWQFKNGLNVQIPHALYYSQRGDRASDCPPSFFRDKYWRYYSKFVSFIRKTSSKKSVGSDIAIFYPIESIWAELTPDSSKNADVIDDSFKMISFTCSNLGEKFDYVSSEFLNDKILSKYEIFILPKVKVLPLPMLQMIKKFINSGKKVIAIDKFPAMATNVSDQCEFDLIYKKTHNKIHYVQATTNRNMAKNESNLGITKRLINLVKVKISPIWFARLLRMAKMLGFKKAVKINTSTGLEGQLRQLL